MTQRDDIATALRDYYANQRIEVADFACAHRTNCVNYAKPRPLKNGMEAHVGHGAVAKLVGIEGGVVSEDINLESSGVEAPDRRPRHDQHYHEDRFLAA